ncbi:DEAD/DEAH box helicase [Terasakiella sp.]|uniref:DEAD/DEAH box helicase n=1 Tax=Terasakiella sp. TaxID=2034861 RepID=UPI003AA9166D
MVQFRKRLGKKVEKSTNPSEIYNQLDRASDKGPLRPSQEHVLEEWHKNRTKDKDVIVKLHTGQGKTLIGLLILQSKLNEGKGPALFLCPNKFLAEQTCEQARQFGFKYCTIEDELPAEFENENAILITHIQKLFNGFSKFKTGARSQDVGTIVLDDSHSCLDSIRKCFTIRINKGEQLYSDLIQIFSDDLNDQGLGTFEDIRKGEYSAFLPISYWGWQDNIQKVTQHIAKYADSSNDIKFAWPLLRDILKECLCIVSGSHIEIAPYMPPVDVFGSYARASQRIYMSATINDDSFFIKHLGVSANAVRNPIVYDNEKWSGEKMILIPQLIDEELNRAKIISLFAKPNSSRTHGIVALTPGGKQQELWGHYKATKATSGNINSLISSLRQGNYESTIAIANRYDGIDLPDNSCRILIIDSKPFSEELIDRYYEEAREDSEVTEVKLAQKVEQGLGRHIRGEKDYGVVLVIGPNLVKTLRSKKTQKFFSPQTRHQIEIGLDVSNWAKEEKEDENNTTELLLKTINQCLLRDEDWKYFYQERMNELESDHGRIDLIEIFSAERTAEEAHKYGDTAKAVKTIQNLLDTENLMPSDKGWYLQEIARYTHKESPLKAIPKQAIAHQKNNNLLKPKEGMVIEKLDPSGTARIDRIKNWFANFTSNEEMAVKTDEILNGLRFGVKADRFEKALFELGEALGFLSQRPEKQWKAGPDNLWCIDRNKYWLFECKSEVLETRPEIHQSETGQMNNSCAWFKKQYPERELHATIIIPSSHLANGAGFNCIVDVMKKGNLKHLVEQCRKFFNEFKNEELKNLQTVQIKEALKIYGLDKGTLAVNYTSKIKGPL